MSIPHSFGPHSFGPHSFGPHSFGPHSFRPHSFRHQLRSIAVRLTIVTVVALGLSPSVAHAAAPPTDSIRVYPAEITMSEALRGGEYARTVGLRNGSSATRIFTLETSGKMGGWVTFAAASQPDTPIDHLRIKPREEQRVIVRVRVPADAANGTYAGAVATVAELENPEVDDEDAAARLRLGAEITLAAKVTGTQRLEGTLLDVSATQEIEPGIPLLASSTVRNDGNVMVEPVVHVAIIEDGAVFEEITSDGQPVFPGETVNLSTAWESDAARVGDHVARVTVDFGGTSLGTRDVPFEVFPRGTLTRSGELESLKLVNEPEAGNVAKVRAEFFNTGRIETRAAFIGELYRGDDLVGTVESRELRVLPQRRVSLDSLVEIPKDGSYRVTGHVVFDGAQTDARTVSFSIGGGAPLLMLSFGGAALAAALAAIAIRRHRRRPRIGGTKRPAGRHSQRAGTPPRVLRAARHLPSSDRAREQSRNPRPRGDRQQITPGSER